MPPSTGKKRSDFFQEALKLAKQAATANEVPIGAVLVKDGKAIAYAHNCTEKMGTFTAHAEILCIQKACRKLKTKFLYDCELFVTLAPCRMCQTAARLSRIKAIHYLAPSRSFGAKGRAYFKTKTRASKSGLTQVAIDLLQAFFKDRR